MTAEGLSLTVIGECENPRCHAPLFEELASDAAGFRLCVECLDRHAARLSAALHSPRPGRCDEDCCR